MQILWGHSYLIFDGTGNGIDLEWKVFRGDKNYKS